MGNATRWNCASVSIMIFLSMCVCVIEKSLTIILTMQSKLAWIHRDLPIPATSHSYIDMWKFFGSHHWQTSKMTLRYTVLGPLGQLQCILERNGNQSWNFMLRQDFSPYFMLSLNTEWWWIYRNLLVSAVQLWDIGAMPKHLIIILLIIYLCLFVFIWFFMCGSWSYMFGLGGNIRETLLGVFF